MSPSYLSGRIAPLVKRAFSSSNSTPRKVAIIGAAGGIGQPLALLTKLNPLVTDLALYDVRGSLGVNADLSHINTKSTTRGYIGADQLGDALKGSDVVIIPAGIPRKPGMTRQDLFNINAGIVKGIAEAISKHSPEALVAVISNPVNSTVPIVAEVFKRAGTFDPKRVFGVTTLDVVRAKTFYASKKSLPVEEVDVPVVGGHAGKTILPLFSQATPLVELTAEEREYLTKRTQDGGTEVVEAKEGAGSATLSMAYAGYLFANSLLKGLNGEAVTEYSFVRSDITSVPYFSSKVTLGPNGAEEVHGLGELNAFEEAALKEALPELENSIKAGVDFVEKSS